MKKDSVFITHQQTIYKNPLLSAFRVIIYAMFLVALKNVFIFADPIN
jgi:hypothetical protein